MIKCIVIPMPACIPLHDLPEPLTDLGIFSLWVLGEAVVTFAYLL
jgi:hypothetical protein